VTEATALSSPDVCASAGVTYRQLDHWARTGWLHPGGGGGTGRDRLWSPDEAGMAGRMGRLTAAGLPVPVAGAFARYGWPRAEIAPGIVVEVTG
jgi:DNA-binding transcriptional MerR regulator